MESVLGLKTMQELKLLLDCVLSTIVYDATEVFVSSKWWECDFATDCEYDTSLQLQELPQDERNCVVGDYVATIVDDCMEYVCEKLGKPNLYTKDEPLSWHLYDMVKEKLFEKANQYLEECVL